VGQGLSIIGGESLEVPSGEASTLERCEDPREALRRRVREHVALAERSGFRIGVTQARDAEVENTPAGSKWIRELLRVEADLDATDALNNATRDRVKALAGALAIIH
jgi:polysaccharide deacetylase 2 family uncharacterized protein YibQ